MKPGMIAGAAGLVAVLLAVAGSAQTVYRPTLTVPDTLAPFLDHLQPGDDDFPLEVVARALLTTCEIVVQRTICQPDALRRQRTSHSPTCSTR